MQNLRNKSSLIGKIPVLVLIGAMFVFLSFHSSIGNNALNMNVNSPQAATIGIYITNDADFQSDVSSSNWAGQGTSANPYLINGTIINLPDNTSTAISIMNVDYYFNITGFNVTNGAFGIYLENVTHASILSNIISNQANDSIEIVNCSSTFVWNNTLSSALNDGIEVDNSLSCDIIMNTLTNSSDNGIGMSGCADFIIENNLVTMNTVPPRDRDAMFENDQDGLIAYNNFDNTTDSGLWFDVGNTLNTITYNNFTNIAFIDLRFEAQSSSNNVVSYNNFYNVSIPSQGNCVLGEYNSVNNWTHNYYGDLTNLTDCNSDGIADAPYSIPGSQNSPLDIDQYPYIFPVGSNGHPILPVNYTGYCPTTAPSTPSTIDGFSSVFVVTFFCVTVTLLVKRSKSKQIGMQLK